MEWKIFLKYYLGSLLTFSVYFISVLYSENVFDRSGDIYKAKLILHCFILLLCFIVATVGASLELTKEKKELIFEEEKQALSPKIDIKLYPSPEKVTPYKFPFKQYKLLIQNLNKNSVTITDFRIEFIFPNIVNVVKQMPLLYTGGSFSVAGLSVYEQKKDGSTYNYEEQPMETAITKNFSLSVQKAKINEIETNTNIVIFNCERWPEKVGFSGEVVVDLSKRPEILKKPDGTYAGIYFYEIKGKKFSERISGTIPNSNVKQ